MALDEMLLQRKKGGPFHVFTSIAVNLAPIRQRVVAVEALPALLMAEARGEEPRTSPVVEAATSVLRGYIDELIHSASRKGGQGFSRYLDQVSRPYKKRARRSGADRRQQTMISALKGARRRHPKGTPPEVVILGPLRQTLITLAKTHGLPPAASEALFGQRSMHACWAAAALANAMDWEVMGGGDSRPLQAANNDLADIEYVALGLLPGCSLVTLDVRARRVFELAERSLDLYLNGVQKS